uniref:Uncharacterized protein n=1 Tax=Psilocybe cubensis TaxID=181762 RepID=A0A8H7XSY8_PSICU
MFYAKTFSSFVRSNTQTAIGNLFATQQKLYDVGARNFLFIDVPPIHRSPAIPKQEENESASYYQVWNTTLRTAIDEFSRNHDDASVFLFSSYEIFENVLDKPKDFGIKPKEVRKAGGQVWVDYLHPTSKVHDILASSLANFLGQI